MSYQDFLTSLFRDVVSLGIAITIVASFIMFVVMKIWRTLEDIIKS